MTCFNHLKAECLELIPKVINDFQIFTEIEVDVSSANRDRRLYYFIVRITARNNTFPKQQRIMNFSQGLDVRDMENKLYSREISHKVVDHVRLMISDMIVWCNTDFKDLEE